MEHKSEHEYREKLFRQHQVDRWGYVYLQIWIYIFVIYLFVENYLNIKIKIDLFMMDNFQVSIWKLLVIIMFMTWILPYSIVMFKDKGIFDKKKYLEKKLKKQKNAVHLHKQMYTKEGIQKLGPRTKLIRLENRIAKITAKLRMLGEWCDDGLLNG